MTLEVKHVKGTRLTLYTAMSDFLDIEIKGFSCTFPEVGGKDNSLLFIIANNQIHRFGDWMTKTQIEKTMIALLKEEEQYAMSLETDDTIRNEVGIDEFDESWFS